MKETGLSRFGAGKDGCNILKELGSKLSDKDVNIKQTGHIIFFELCIVF